MESLGYVLMYFTKSTLPWQGLKVMSTETYMYLVWCIGETQKNLCV